jgi:hypothetical protein
MKTETKQVHECDFCGKKLFVKGAMVRHEDNCVKNPKNWTACHECDFCKLVKKPITRSNYTWIDSNSYYCSNENIKKEMHPFKSVRKGLVKKYPETFKDSILMPKTCEFFKRKPLD